MKISKDLPQFTKRSGLLLVFSGLKAKFIKLSAGQAGEWNVFKGEIKEKKEKEGLLRTRAHGKTIRSGAVYEDDHQEEMKEFIKEFKKYFKRSQLLSISDDLYIFCPERFCHFLTKKTSKEWESKIKLVIKGDYYNRHLFSLLKKIELEIDKNKVKIAPPPRARKVLDKTNRKK